METDYFKCYCRFCGWSGMSNKCIGGEYNGIDYENIRCPVCNTVEPDDYSITKKEWIKIILRWISLYFVINWIKQKISDFIEDKRMKKWERDWKRYDKMNKLDK